MKTYLKEIRFVAANVESRLGSAASREGMVLKLQALRSFPLMKGVVLRASRAKAAMPVSCGLDITPFSAMRSEFAGSILAP